MSLLVVEHANGAAKMPPPEPGIHEQVPEKIYRAWDAVNQSSLKADDRSMAHLRYAIDHGREPSDPMKMGTAAHIALLEPSRFKSAVAVMPRVSTDSSGKEFKVNRANNKGKAFIAAFEEEHAGKTIIGEEGYANARAMWKAVMAHGEARKLIEMPGPIEVAAVWNDKETRLRCKARLDKFIPGVLALDIKTCDTADADGFAAAFERWGYHRQLAWYEDGFKAATDEETPFVFIAVENSPPHGVIVWRPHEMYSRVGRWENVAALRRYAECAKSGVWPSYPAGVHVLEPTGYFKKKWKEFES